MSTDEMSTGGQKAAERDDPADARTEPVETAADTGADTGGDTGADTMAATAPATADAAPASAQEVAALQAEVERLRRRNAELESPRAVRVRHAARSTLVVVLTIIGALCLTLAVPAVWARNEVLDTDRYVADVQPLASNPDVQATVEAAVNRQIAANFDVNAAVSQIVPPQFDRLKAPIASAVSGLIATVIHKVVTSDAFLQLWSTANRAAHASLVGILTGENQGQAVTASDNTLRLNIGPLIDQVKTRLVASGLGVAASIPTVNTSIQIAQLQGLERTQQLVRWLDTLASWLPWIGLVALAGAVALARGRRWRALMWAGLATAIGLLLLRLGLIVGREVYLTRMQSTNMSPQTASYVFDTVTRYLVDGIRLVFIIALVVAGLAALLNRREAVARFGRWVARVSSRTWDSLRDGPVGTAVGEHAPAAAGVVIALGTLVLVIWSNPTGLVVLLIAIVVALLLAAVWGMAQGRTHTGLPAH
ncbi:hypothetical protein [Terrabacter sp. BE26]|uniref:hypothetical protein n=1 Tax=Terrabacter sp. BE26 TaxID=2898152 RepID=UPI0035BE2750